MTTVIWSINQSFISEMVTNYIKTYVVSGATQKETARNEGLCAGTQMGLADGVAAFANQLRSQAIREVADPSNPRGILIRSMYGHVFRRWLNDLKKSWDGGEWAGKSDTEFYEAAEKQFNDMVFDEEFKEQLALTRKDSVRSGYLKPEAQDIEWLKEELDAIVAVEMPLADLLKKARMNKDGSAEQE
jgi:hypothetical protein